MTGWWDLEAQMTISLVPWNETAFASFAASCWSTHMGQLCRSLWINLDSWEPVALLASHTGQWVSASAHKAIWATPFTSFTLSNILGQKGLLIQTLLPEVMRIYSSQLTSPHKVLSWLYLFMIPSWYRFVRCIWYLFYFFLPLHSIGTEEFLQNMQSCPAIFCIQINI